jgi:hypothetical protein
MQDYVVVMAADADAWFLPEDGNWQINLVPSPVGPVTVILDTRWADEGYSSRVPREMWVEARGSSEKPFKDVLSAYANASAQFLPVVAFTTNAYVGDLEPKLAFDSTPSASERPYFQSFVREERETMLRPGRWVDAATTAEFATSLFAHPETDRLWRAIGQYALALSHWRFGHEIRAVAHLYIAGEALTPIAIRTECERLGTDRDGLADAWGLESPRHLDAEARKRLIFRGDDATYRNARHASDGFEYSFLEFAQVRELSRDVRDATATYIREAIIDLAGTTESVRARLLKLPRSTPVRSFLTRYLWAELVGESAAMAIEGEEYPGFLWTSRLKEVELDGRKLNVTPDETITARFNSALQCRSLRIEMFGPTGIETKSLVTNARVARGATGEFEEVELTKED